MKKGILIGGIIAGLLLSACGGKVKAEEEGKAPEEKLIVYTSHKPEIYEPIIKEFEERSGIWVQVVEGGTNELLNQIAVNGEYGCADVMFGGGVDSLTAYSEYFEPYRTKQYDKLENDYASETDAYTVFSELPIVFVYNEKLVISAGTPRSFSELLNPMWKGRIAFANPELSGSAYTALATMIQALSETNTEEEVIRGFVANLNGDISEGSGEAIDQVVSGNKAIGITLEETALKRIDEGAKIGIAYPTDGTSLVPDGCAILKNAPNRDNAELFMEFIVGDDVQHLLEDKLSRRSVRTDIESLNPVVKMDYDLEYAISTREKVMSLWKSYTGGQ